VHIPVKKAIQSDANKPPIPAPTLPVISIQKRQPALLHNTPKPWNVTVSIRHKPDVHRIRMKPTEKWESWPSISPEAVAHRQCQKLGSSRPNGHASFLGCPAPGQRIRS